MSSNISMIDGHDDAVVQGDLISRSALIGWHNESIEWLTNLICKTKNAEVQSLATREMGAFMESLRFIEKAPAVDKEVLKGIIGDDMRGQVQSPLRLFGEE